MTINMHDVTYAIIHMKIEDADTLATLKKRFYSIMSKHGVKNGKKVKNGVQCSNPEWVACNKLFYDRLTSKLEMDSLFIDKIPKKLWY